ncbi:MAG: IS21 family transposase [bacterium]|nr:IS21 family transposase [bacterium]
MRKIREILRLKYEVGLTHRAIARACSVGVGTVSLYVTRAREAGLVWPLPLEMDEAALEARLLRGPRSPTGARPQPEVAHIHEELRRVGVTLHLLWMEYLEVHPDGYRYSQFCEIYRRWAKKLDPSMRQRYRAGEKAFVDYSGKRPHIVDRRTGEEIPVELFVGVLGASSYTYAEVTASQELHNWIASHTRMLAFFSGSPEIYVPDNLKSGITKPCRYEAGVNRTYQTLAEHYGAVVIPARPGKPRDKAKVEANVLVAQRFILGALRDRTFFSLAEFNQAIREKLLELNNRPMQHLGASRRELYERLDRPALKPLPAERYQMAEWKPCRVNIDYHVAVERNYYSVPYQLVGELLEASFTPTIVEVYSKSKRVASHRRLAGRGQASTVPEHMPRSHRAHAEWTPSRLVRWAQKTGPATGRLVAEILNRHRHPEQGYRACLGILRLGKRYGSERLEAAARRAERLRSYSYTTIKNILSSGADRLPLEEESEAPDPTPHHDNIRGATYYAAKEIEC